MRALPIAPVAAILLLAAALAGAAIAPAVATATPDVQLGIEQNGGMHAPDHRALILDTQQAMGSDVIRFVLRFDEVARACDPARAGDPTAPTNRCYDFSVPDAVVQGAHDRGMRVLLSVYGTPRWKFDAAENWTGGSDAEYGSLVAHLADFTQAAATRYDGRHGQPRVSQWTIWNEPNGSFFQPRVIAGTLVGPARYARMYDAAARRIKAVDPTLEVAFGPTAPHAAALPPMKFAAAALPVLQQLGSPIDAWAHNAYMGAQSPLSSTIKPPYVGLGNLHDLTELMDRYGVAKGRPIWVTEFGYQTNGFQKAVDEPRQALLTADVMFYIHRHERITTFIWYSLHDDELDAGPYSFQSGLFRPATERCGGALCAKPAARMFLHTLWISAAQRGVVTLWGQGRMQPAATRIYVKRPGDGWRAYANADTAQTGTVQVRMALPVGTEVMTCDIRCGELRTIEATVSGGGGSGVRVQRLRLVRLAKRASLRSGIVYGVNCTGCRVSAQIIARGRASGIAAARRRSVVIGRGRITTTATGTRVLLRFTPAARRELTRRRSAVVTLRTFIRYGDGRRVVTLRPVRLV